MGLLLLSPGSATSCNLTHPAGPWGDPGDMTPSFSGSATSLVNGSLATCLIWEVEKDQINIKDELHKDKPKEMSSSPPLSGLRGPRQRS